MLEKNISKTMSDKKIKKAINDYLKAWTQKPTVLEAKITLGHRLALVYSAAYDRPKDFGIDIEKRWLVTLDKKDSSYLVEYVPPGRTEAQREVWAGMTLNAAYRHVRNPAHLMIMSGSLELWQKDWPETNRTHFDKRILLLDWINPREVRALEAEAIDQYVQGRQFSRLSAAEGRLQPVTYDKDGMKAQIVTGHKTYDSQIGGIGTGNYWAQTMHGDYIRPYQETGCNGMTWLPGELRESDLQYYKDIGTPQKILKAVREAAIDKGVIFYVLFHFDAPRGYSQDYNRVIHGYILTDESAKLLARWTTGPTHKSQLVMDGILPYLAWKSEAPGSAS